MLRAGLVLLATTAFAQTAFDPKLPANVPAVTGSVVESATMRHIDTSIGQGERAKPGQRYTVHYTGWLRNGTKFDSSVDRNEPFQFVQGRRQVIAGWEMGFEGMKTGGKRRLFIPYQLAYGEAGSGSIPPKSELIFDVELLKVEDVPQTPAGADVLFSLSSIESKVLALAKAVPEEKYAWRPGPGVRSFGEVFYHIANGNQFLLKLGTDNPTREVTERLIGENVSREKQARNKEEILKALAESFAAVRKAIEPMRAGLLGRDAAFFGQPTTVRGVFIILDAHASEHLGQAIAYARMNGIVPPWSSGGKE